MPLIWGWVRQVSAPAPWEIGAWSQLPAVPCQGQDEVEVSPPPSILSPGPARAGTWESSNPSQPVQRLREALAKVMYIPSWGTGRGDLPCFGTFSEQSWLLWQEAGCHPLAQLCLESHPLPLNPHLGVSLPATGPLHGLGVGLTRPDQGRRGWSHCPQLTGATGLGQQLYLHFASCFSFFSFLLYVQTKKFQSHPPPSPLQRPSS